MTTRPFTHTPLMTQQVEALQRLQGRTAYGLRMEQGTGKTLTLLEDAMRLHAAGVIDAVLVLAPNGVHENWVLNEIPTHIPPNIPVCAAYYVSPAAANRRERAAMQRLMTARVDGEVPALRVLTMSYDSLLAIQGFKFAEAFVLSSKCMIIADESQRIKNLTASRTKRALLLRQHCVVSRIATGTAIANSPVDAFAQFEFLESGCLGTDSPVAFKAEYCELLPPQHSIMRQIAERIERRRGRKLTEAQRMHVLPQIVKSDAAGRPVYKNLERLGERLDEWSYRVLKSDCLDLPEKVYETRFFHLSAAHRKVYDRMEEEQRFLLEDETLLATSRLVAMGKLRQITSGFLLMRDGTVSYMEDNPRIELLQETLEDLPGQGIIWAQHREELRNIKARLDKMELSCEVVDGSVPMGQRRAVRDAFQAGELKWIAAHPATMGTGFTLTAATTHIYYSNGFSLLDRLQSEDRSHRIGQRHTVTYIDFVAIDTRDDDVVWALQHKLDTAAMINGDPARKSRFAEKEVAA